MRDANDELEQRMAVLISGHSEPQRYRLTVKEYPKAFPPNSELSKIAAEVFNRAFTERELLDLHPVVSIPIEELTKDVVIKGQGVLNYSLGDILNGGTIRRWSPMIELGELEHWFRRTYRVIDCKTCYICDDLDSLRISADPEDLPRFGPVSIADYTYRTLIAPDAYPDTEEVRHAAMRCLTNAIKEHWTPRAHKPKLYFRRTFRLGTTILLDRDCMEVSITFRAQLEHPQLAKEGDCFDVDFVIDPP